ncbi:lipase 1-like [Manduca sexta]|uniref:lipase 1-like n=1 Tax=Manduca sexta TaxID=7130 RepID=UPI00188E8319|nr:lipase 1-like [Manduca sexta]
MKLLLLLSAIIVKNVLLENCLQSRIPEDGRLDFTGLVRKYGYVAEEYDLITPDGYVIQLHRIVGDHTRPVLLIHGAIIASDSFIIRGETSLGIILARQGYDVWAVNTRGNRYSRRHLTLNPDVNKEFWNFDLHEIAYYDVPLTIDFILSETGVNKLKVIGYSQGTTVTFIMGATRPEYNEKISIFIALAPVHIMENSRPPTSTVIEYSPQINQFLIETDNEEFMGFHSPFKKIWDFICTKNVTGTEICLYGALYQLCGVDIDEIEDEFFPVIVGHFPAGSSTKGINHFGQIGRKKVFGRYDYGPENNKIVYGSSLPPRYDVSKVIMKVALFLGLNDKIATVEDAALLRRELPNVVLYHEVERPLFNHLDFIWGKSTYKTLYPLVLDTLEKYG